MNQPDNPEPTALAVERAFKFVLLALGLGVLIVGAALGIVCIEPSLRYAALGLGLLGAAIIFTAWCYGDHLRRHAQSSEPAEQIESDNGGGE